MNIMRPVKNRVPGHIGELPAIRKAVEREAARYDCSMSFVRNVAIAWALGISIDEDYKKDTKVTTIRRKRA